MTPWDRATLALTLLAIDPKGFAGLIVRARVSPVRDAFMQIAKQVPMPHVKLHPSMTAQILDGEIDLSSTLENNTLVMQKGLLDRTPSLFTLPMAERVDPYLSARLSQTLDAGEGHAFLALDEGVDEDEAIPASLADRAAFWISLDGLALADFSAFELPQNLDALAKDARKVDIPDDIPEQLVALAVSLGISSLRAPTLALRTAQTHAALQNRSMINADDMTLAVDLVYAHRATRMPEMTEDEPDQPQDAQQSESQQNEDESLTIPEDLLLDAVKAALPSDLLEKLASGAKNKRNKGTGTGAKRTGNRRGRPLPARAGSKSSSARVDLIATLRAAIPYQTIRKRAHPERLGPIIRPNDLLHKRYQSMSDRLLIFAVDASGSAAMARLAEAKGAVEMLLGEAYARRDHVALISFRGLDAEILLPPTRSLVQTKRRLAALPGGGGTPLASGLSAAMSMAQTAAQKGMSATIVLLTDGRANVALDGQANRKQAGEDAEKLAREISMLGLETLVIDTTVRPERALKALADKMHGTYIAMPRADAKGVSAAVTASLSS